MKRSVRRLSKAFLLATLLFMWVLHLEAQTTIRIVSDKNWTVSDTNGNDLGTAQNVCLNATAPSNCPLGAIIYGYGFNGWTANLSSISGATWIWAPNITGASSHPNNAAFIFQTQYILCCDAQNGTLSVAADNSAEVFIDDVSVSTSAGPNVLSTINILPAFLRRGVHNIKVKVKNDDQSPCNQYQCNPAAMVFGALITDPHNKLPTCTKSDGTKVDANYNDSVPCFVNGQPGFKSRLCACLVGCNQADWIYGACRPTPQTCKGKNGVIFTVGGNPEQLDCPAGFSGSQSHACIAQDTWGPTTGTCNPPPPVKKCTGSDGVTTFLPGASETEFYGYCADVSRSRTCQADGSWSAFSAYIFPLVKAGEKCGDKEHGECRACPPGTTCKPKVTTSCSGWWIFRRCITIQSTDYYCLPN